MTDDLPPEPPIPPENPAPASKRKKSKYGPGRPRKGEVREPKLPPPASPVEASANLHNFAEEAAKLVLTGKNLPVGERRFGFAKGEVSPVVAAHIKHLFGENIEKAREDFAVALLGVAAKIAERIDKEVDDLPHSNLAFTMSVCVDKASQLLNKVATSSAGAAVGTQINFFGDGTVDRETLIRRLSGLPDAPPEAPPSGPVVDV